MNKQIVLDPFNISSGSGLVYSDMNKFLGTVLEKITLTLGGTFTKSMISLIELKANSKVIFQTSGANLDLTNLYQGGANDATILKIDFMNRKAVTPNARSMGAIDLSAKSRINTLRLEITFAGATNPTLVGVCDVSPPIEDPAEDYFRWLMIRRHRATFVVPAAGTFALPVPHIDPFGGGGNYLRINFFSAQMSGFKTVRNGITEHELTKLQNEACQKDNFKFPQANLVVFDPTQDGQVSGRLWDTRQSSKVQSAQFYGTFAAGETITIEAEELLPLVAY